MYTGNIRHIIQTYQKYFAELNKEERYKWQSVQTFQEHWDIDAADFGAMLKKAMPKKIIGNLMDDGWSQPLDQLNKMTIFKPEAVRRLFRLLYQENLGYQTARFVDTITMFKKAAHRLYAEYKPGDACDQNEHAAMFYLTMRYPEQFTFYKLAIFERLYKAANVRLYMPPNIGDIGKLQLYLRLIELIRYEIARNPEFMQLAADAIGAGEYRDPAYRILAEDVAYSLKNDRVFKSLHAPVMTRPRNLLVSKPHEKSELLGVIGKETDEEQIYLDAALMIVRENEQQLVNRFCTSFDVMPDCIFKGREIGYSIRTVMPEMQPAYILVKASGKGFYQPIKLLPEEIEFSEQHAGQFRLYYIYNFDPFGEIMTANIARFSGSLKEIVR